MATKKILLPLAIAVVASALAVGTAFAVTATEPTAVAVTDAASVSATVTASPRSDHDQELLKQCLAADRVPNPGDWWAGAKIDADAADGFLVIRTDKTAAVCHLEHGKGVGLVGGLGRDTYGKLTAERPFTWLNAMNYEHSCVQFGIATAEVTAVSLIGPDNSATPAAALSDGTFIVKTTFSENSNEPTTNHVRATVRDGKVIEGPFRG